MPYVVARYVNLERRKPCSDCKDMLPLTRFGRNRQAKDGLHYYCKQCAAKRQKKWAKANPAKVRKMREDYLTKIREQNADRDPYTPMEAMAA